MRNNFVSFSFFPHPHPTKKRQEKIQATGRGKDMKLVFLNEGSLKAMCRPGKIYRVEGSMALPTASSQMERE